MTAAYRSPVAHLVGPLDRAVSDYLSRMSDAQQRAALVTAGQAHDDDGLPMYGSVQALRLAAHENDIANECMTLAQSCAVARTRVQLRAYAHACWCRARASRSVQTVASPSLSLAQIAHLFADHRRSTHAPPGRVASRCVLSTCQASNAPGLVRHASQTERMTT